MVFVLYLQFCFCFIVEHHTFYDRLVCPRRVALVLVERNLNLVPLIFKPLVSHSLTYGT